MRTSPLVVVAPIASTAMKRLLFADGEETSVFYEQEAGLAFVVLFTYVVTLPKSLPPLTIAFACACRGICEFVDDTGVFVVMGSPSASQWDATRARAASPHTVGADAACTPVTALPSSDYRPAQLR